MDVYSNPPQVHILQILVLVNMEKCVPLIRGSFSSPPLSPFCWNLQQGLTMALPIVASFSELREIPISSKGLGNETLS